MLLWSPIPTWYDRRLYRPAAKLAHHFTLLHTAQKIGGFLGALRSYLPCILYPKAYFWFALADFPVHGQIFSDGKGALYCRFERLPSRDPQTESVSPIALHGYWCKPWIAAAHDKVLQVSPSSSQVLLIHRDWLSWDPLCLLFVCLLWGLSSHSRIFHSFGDVIITDEELQILTYARDSWPLSMQ